MLPGGRTFNSKMTLHGDKCFSEWGGRRAVLANGTFSVELELMPSITSGNLEEASKHAFLHNLFHGVGGPSSGLIEMDYETNKTDCRKKKRARTPSVKVAAMFVWPLMEMEVEEVRNREIRAAQDAAAGDVDADGGADGSTGRRGTGGGSKTTAVNPNLEHKAIMKSLVADMLKKTDLEEEVTSKKRHV